MQQRWLVWRVWSRGVWWPVSIEAELLKGMEVSLTGIGVLAEVVGELIPEDRLDLKEKLSDFLDMSAEILDQEA